MAYSITNECISCNACKIVCPQNAIRRTSESYAITSHRCNECDSQFKDAQCASICPVENAIIDSDGLSLNVTHSLTPSADVLEKVLNLASAK